MIAENQHYDGGRLTSREVYDTTAGTLTSYDGAGKVTATRPLTAEETALFQALQVSETAKQLQDANRATNEPVLTARAQAALQTNTAFLALPDYPANPTAAQRDQAIRALIDQARSAARQNNAVIRLLLGAFDDTTGT